jgi:hypothetical protein
MPEQQESEKSAERRRQQLVAECWRMNTGVNGAASLPSTWVAQDSTACICSRKQRRDETSQGTWDAWCRAKVHGTLTSKLCGASTELSSRIIQNMGKAMEEAKLYRRYRRRRCRPPKLRTSSSMRMHSGTGKQAQGLWRRDAWWRDMTDHRASSQLRNRGLQILTRAQQDDTGRHISLRAAVMWHGATGLNQTGQADPSTRERSCTLLATDAIAPAGPNIEGNTRACFRIGRGGDQGCISF